MNRQLGLWGDNIPDGKTKSSVIKREPVVDTVPSTASKRAATNQSVQRLFTNPDRQAAFDSDHRDDWPPAELDEDTITIDRPRPDIDGPAHRFTIRRTDFVEVYLGNNTVGYGTVIAIAPNKHRARISFDDETTGWFDIEDVYPAKQPRKGSRTRKRPQDIAGDIGQIQETVSSTSETNRRVETMAEYTSIKVVTLVRTGTLEGRPKITSTADACQFFAKYWEENPGQDQERFMVACLDTKHRVQSVVLITVGTLDASLVHPREVFKPAILEGSSAILLSHNHPSGDPTPSEEDRQVTERLTDAGKLIGITVLDHIVHGDGSGKVISIREA